MSLSGPGPRAAPNRLPPLVDATGLHLLRFAVIAVSLELATLAGVSGWTLGLVANVAVTVLAVVLMTRRKLWRCSGMTTLWRSRVAALALLPLCAEAISWALPAGITARTPGLGLWALTLLLVGVNEELFSRGLVLERLRPAYRPTVAAVTTAALFGLQHLSALVLTSREAGDVLGNVALSAVAGLALTAFQLRFRWLWPLILVHATADWVIILASRALPDAFIGVAHLLLLLYAVVLLRGLPADLDDGASRAPSAPARRCSSPGGPEARSWLAVALDRVQPGHPWRARLG